AWIRGLSIDCGCFGGGGDVPSAGRAGRYLTEIGRDLVFMALAIWLIRFPSSRLSLDRLTGIAVEIGEDDNNPDETDESS
ncbi:MAG: DoxX family protein, partial [Acidimicrobiia bacterium]